MRELPHATLRDDPGSGVDDEREGLPLVRVEHAVHRTGVRVNPERRVEDRRPEPLPSVEDCELFTVLPDLHRVLRELPPFGSSHVRHGTAVRCRCSRIRVWEMYGEKVSDDTTSTDLEVVRVEIHIERIRVFLSDGNPDRRIGERIARRPYARQGHDDLGYRTILFVAAPGNDCQYREYHNTPTKTTHGNSSFLAHYRALTEGTNKQKSCQPLTGRINDATVPSRYSIG